MTANVLERPTLVLNKLWQPVSVQTVAETLVKVWVGSARVVDPHDYAQYTWNDWTTLRPDNDDSCIKLVGATIRVPEVVTLANYGKVPTRTVSFSRRNLYLRDKNTCQYCGVKLRSSEVTIDHIQPRSRGGLTTWENCVVACLDCNGKKADRTPREAGMRLRSDPKKPQWTPAFHCKLRIPSWEKFVSAIYWNVELEE